MWFISRIQRIQFRNISEDLKKRIDFIFIFNFFYNNKKLESNFKFKLLFILIVFFAISNFYSIFNEYYYDQRCLIMEIWLNHVIDYDARKKKVRWLWLWLENDYILITIMIKKIIFVHVYKKIIINARKFKK